MTYEDREYQKVFTPSQIDFSNSPVVVVSEVVVVVVTVVVVELDSENAKTILLNVIYICNRNLREFNHIAITAAKATPNTTNPIIKPIRNALDLIEQHSLLIPALDTCCRFSLSSAGSLQTFDLTREFVSGDSCSKFGGVDVDIH